MEEGRQLQCHCSLSNGGTITGGRHQLCATTQHGRGEGNLSWVEEHQGKAPSHQAEWLTHMHPICNCPLALSRKCQDSIEAATTPCPLIRTNTALSRPGAPAGHSWSFTDFLDEGTSSMEETGNDSGYQKYIRIRRTGNVLASRQ